VKLRPPHAPDRTMPLGPERKERADRPNRNRKRPDILAWVRLGAGLILAVQCARVAFTSPRLRLQEVRVSGTKRLTPEDVIRAGGIHLGQNIFRINLVSVSQHLLADPVLKEAVVTRELPDAIRVVLKDRTAALRLESADGAFDADAAGVVFRKAVSAPADLPRLEVPEKDVPALGRRLDEGVFQTALECVRLAGEEGIGLRKMRVDATGELWLNVAAYTSGESGPGELKVRVGRSTDLQAKFHDIHQALAGIPDLTARAAYLDVMCAGRSAYVPLADRTVSR
jgi:hypothetical protein